MAAPQGLVRATQHGPARLQPASLKSVGAGHAAHQAASDGQPDGEAGHIEGDLLPHARSLKTVLTDVRAQELQRELLETVSAISATSVRQSEYGQKSTVVSPQPRPKPP